MKLGEILCEGQLVIHVGETGTWMGQYNEKEKGILYEGVVYTSLSAFVYAHTGKKRDGWKECQIEVDGEMVQASTMKYFLRIHHE
jgi:hypothetical protein